MLFVITVYENIYVIKGVHKEMGSLQDFIHGSIEIGLFLTFGLPAVLTVIGGIFVLVQKGFPLSFVGRTNRKFFIIQSVACFVIMIGVTVLSNKLELVQNWYIAQLICFVIVVLSVIGYIAVCARRLHDLGHSAWWVLLLIAIDRLAGYVHLAIIPLFILIALASIKGNEGTNKYGESPSAAWMFQE